MTSKNIILTVAVVAILVAAGGIGYYFLSDDGEESNVSGMVVDYGNYETEWYNEDFSNGGNSLEILKSECTVIVDTDGKVTSVNGVSASGEMSWDYWEFKNNEFVKMPGNPDIDIKSSAAIWALTDSGTKPSLACDATGKCLYGRGEINRIISLVPSATESVCAVGGGSKLIGVDSYSYYPDAVSTKTANGTIAVLGSYGTPPSSEEIFSKSPDLVIIENESSEYNSLQLVNKLRELGIDVLVILSGHDIDTIYNNIHMIGSAIGKCEEKETVINDIKDGIAAVMNEISTLTSGKKVIASTWPGYATGPDSFTGDTLLKLGVTNAVTSGGWIEASSESVFAQNPDTIVLFSEFSNYDDMLNALSPLWKNFGATTYWVHGSAADILSRPGPRIAQAFEIMALMLFDSYPNHAGIAGLLNGEPTIDSGYSALLTHTGNLSFNEVF